MQGLHRTDIAHIIRLMNQEMLGPNRLSLLSGVSGRDFEGGRYEDGKIISQRGPTKNIVVFEGQDGSTVTLVVRLEWLAEMNNDGQWEMKDLPVSDFERSLGIAFINGMTIDEQFILLEENGTLVANGAKFLNPDDKLNIDDVLS